MWITTTCCCSRVRPWRVSPYLVENHGVFVVGQDVVGLDLGRRVQNLHLLLEELGEGVLASVLAGQRLTAREVQDRVVGVVAEEPLHVAFGQCLGCAPGDLLIEQTRPPPHRATGRAFAGRATPIGCRMPMTKADARDRGRESFGRQAWNDAYAQLSAADR